MNPNKQRLILRFIYGGISLILLALVISIPETISQDTDFNDYTIAKDVLQKIIVATLAAAIWLAAKLYQRNLDQIKRIRALKENNGQLEANLLDAVKHIGSVNIRMDAISSALNIKNYPKSKEEFKTALALFAEKIITIANTDWVMIRLVNTTNNQTIKEHVSQRGNTENKTPNIKNEMLICKKTDGCINISSDQETLTVKVFCLMPKIDLSKEQEELVKTMANQLEMLFIIYSSKYYKNN